MIGDTIGSPRLQSYAAWTSGLTRTLTGEWEAGSVQGQRAVEQAPLLYEESRARFREYL